MLDLEFAELSDVGRVRGHNEDYLGHAVPASEVDGRTHGWLFALADGVGGEELGEVASQTAIESLIAGFRAAPRGEAHTVLMPRLVQSANTRIYELGKAASPGGSRMATTIVACALRYDRVVVAHVGDSRCYLVRNAKAKHITQDHTWVNEQRKMGIISASEMAESESRHVLIRSLGPEMFVSPDTTAVTLLAGDVLVLSSDGVHDELNEAELSTIVSQTKNIDEIVRELVARAVEIDGNDNTTAQVIRVRSVEQIGMYRGRPYRLPS
jgi:protein phosphatase